MLAEHGAREEDNTIRCVATPAAGGDPQTELFVLESLTLDYSPETVGQIVQALREGRTPVERKVDDDGGEWELRFSVIDNDRFEQDVEAWVADNPADAERAGLAD